MGWRCVHHVNDQFMRVLTRIVIVELLEISFYCDHETSMDAEAVLTLSLTNSLTHYHSQLSLPLSTNSLFVIRSCSRSQSS